MVYQSFPSEDNGDSNSTDKLNKLYLPSLEGLSVLDIGCNEGFFCFEALNKGAKRTVGIDRSKLYIEKATKRAEDLSLSQSAQFICQDWQNLPDEKFDIVFLFSALHYAEDQFALIDQIMERVSETGTFILECGVHATSNKSFTKVKRGTDERYYPSLPLLHDFLSKYGYRILGKSVLQKGDPVDRWVVHITHKKDFCILISGPSLSGKTTLAKILRSNNMDVTSLDTILVKFVRSNPKLWGDLDVSRCNYQLNMFYNFLNIDTDICDLYIEEIKHHLEQKRSTNEKKSIFFIEGFGLNIETISRKLIGYLENNGFILWNLTRPLSEQGEIEILTNKEIQGWAFSNSLLKPQIEIIADNKLVGLAETHIIRNDIHQRYPHAPFNSGFQFELPKFPKKFLKYKSVIAKFKYQGNELKLATSDNQNSQADSFISSVLRKILQLFK
jgi:ubiquinone/menaquinone biosynthesis C-methylase UbiE